ncbi:PREDICTED: uncharacterized protein LOC101312887 [Fragaria vesca subsp. vesca]|uniref:uncharacterized protein LOC101312887 n=1 Tax=Fragaria vesca subsp. vesca TaxID=101020 RepID=UPI0002C361A8|nr:PREDICTED: uncharacterized protein LOC101312887 [Fragaria vesca subsp. vesca]
MSSSSYPYVLIPLMMLLLVYVTTPVDGKVTVTITNTLPGNPDLTLHCKSKDDDLGEHLLHPGNSYHFRFGVSWIGTTMFWCTFQWSGQSKYFHVYDNDRDDCNACTWTLREAGPCLQGKKETCYVWR